MALTTRLLERRLVAVRPTVMGRPPTFAAVAALGLLAAGCGVVKATPPNGGGRDMPGLCGASFELSLVSDRGGQPTPLAAATWFASHGHTKRVPASGWHVIGRSVEAATAAAHNSTLHIIEGPDDTWQVDSGHDCG